jgi:hypothetical protein
MIKPMLCIDISPTACRVMAKRLRDVCGLPESECFGAPDAASSSATCRGRHFGLRWQAQRDTAFARAENHRLEWRQRALESAVAAPALPAHQDVSSSAAPRKQQPGELGLKERWYPIQVKQKDKAGRPDIDAFEAMLMREDCEKGFFVSFDYSSDALPEIESFFKRSHKVIVALTVQEILDEHIAKKLA